MSSAFKRCSHIGLHFSQIDWQEVADQLDITNGHAARMRYSRFKAQMEGTPTQTRKPRATGPRQRKPKPDKPPTPETTQMEAPQILPEAEPAVKGEAGAKDGVMVKAEPGVEDEAMEGTEPSSKPESKIKEEPRDGMEVAWSSDGGTAVGAVDFGTANEGQQDLDDAGRNEEVARPSMPAASAAAEEVPAVKAEP